MSSPNRYFNNYTFTPTQKLVEDLIEEAIRIHGVWVNYLPKTSVNLDQLFGESSMMTFNDSVQIEAYIKNADGFEGQRLMSKFGVEIQDELVLTISQRRFEEIRAEHLLLETGHILEQETTSRYAAGQFNGILLEEGNIEKYYIPYSRPKEGDLIWIGLLNKLFEIKFVQHDAIFYQNGKLQTFDMFCEAYRYSHEQINTGDSGIDNLEDLFSGDVLSHNIVSESNEDLNLEEGGKVIQEGTLPENTDAQANNNLYTTETSDVIDFSEMSPFIKRDINLRW